MPAEICIHFHFSCSTAYSFFCLDMDGYLRQASSLIWWGHVETRPGCKSTSLKLRNPCLDNILRLKGIK